MSDLEHARTIPFVPADAGTQRFGQRTGLPLSAFALRASSDSNPPELAKRAKAGSRERTEYVSAIRDHAYTITAKVVVESMAKKHRHCPVSEVHDTSQHPMTRTSETKGHQPNSTA